MLSLQHELNPAQKEAVEAEDGCLLVIAGAGSGKTLTLTCRVARLVASGVDPSAILLLTFTRKAAQEMLRRATLLLDARCSRVSGGTFHSFATGVLRRFGGRIGFENGFSILDRADSEDLVQMVKKDLEADHATRILPRKGTLMSIFSRAANMELSLEEMLVRDYGHFLDDLSPMSAVLEEYTRRKLQLGFMDYDDLLIHLKRLLTEHPDVAERLAARYRYVMVDEYQDTNRIQADILRCLSRNNIMVVGDDSQSIYSFRGAHFKNIMDFPEIFGASRIIKLEENFRSTQPVLDLANAVIERARHKYAKRLFTRRGGGPVPELVRCGSEADQSLFVLEHLGERLNEGVALNDVAVLFRSAFLSFDLEMHLNREGIPFVKHGGFKFMESAHIKDMLAHLRVVAAPYDHISWFRLLRLLEGVGPKAANDAFAVIRGKRKGLNGFFDVKFSKRARPGAERLGDLFADLGREGITPAEAAEAVLEYYLPILETLFDDHPRRKRDLEQLADMTARYESLEDFITDMTLEPPSSAADGGLHAGEDEADRLVLSTIHSAKGLEWDTVFVIGAVDGRFPSTHAYYDTDALEEELRLMYVAVTRARDRLFVTYPEGLWDRASGRPLFEPSRFLRDIPESILTGGEMDYGLHYGGL